MHTQEWHTHKHFHDIHADGFCAAISAKGLATYGFYILKKRGNDNLSTWKRLSIPDGGFLVKYAVRGNASAY
jgi:hypothetical protein